MFSTQYISCVINIRAMKYAKLEIIVDMDEFTPIELEERVKRELEQWLFEVKEVKSISETDS